MRRNLAAAAQTDCWPPRYRSRPLIIALVAIALASTILSPAAAAEVRLLAAGALKGAMERLIPEFESRSGTKVEASFDLINVIADRLRKGEVFDLATETPTQWEALAREGRIDPSLRVAVASVKWGLYVKKSMPKPRIDSVEALKQALLEAHSVSYSSVQGPIQAYQARVTEKLGLVEALKAKAKYGRVPRPGEIGVTFEVVTNGEAEIGFGTVSEILARPALDLVGPMPTEVQETLTFLSVLPINAREPAQARALVDFLAAPSTRSALAAAGLEPG
ncbi:MAG TPA: substrate-binding domain-containing protein [Stellaceae bacterium]|jgi:molybdate transport system substrate-binding protein|nr:substrate-binding domain-containing protein [Stellaceae bacterium]